MAQKLESGRRQGYASELAGLWSELARTLQRLEQIAGRPVEELGSEDALDELARLRYTLHVAAERAFGLLPPRGAEASHEELAAALADARDATAEVAEAVEADGVEAAEVLVLEWRGALFRVRLARMRLADSPQQPPQSADADGDGRRRLLAPLLSLALVLAGAAAFVLGAGASSWPVWTLGVVAVGAGLLVYRP